MPFIVRNHNKIMKYQTNFSSSLYLAVRWVRLSRPYHTTHNLTKFWNLSIVLTKNVNINKRVKILKWWWTIRWSSVVVSATTHHQCVCINQRVVTGKLILNYNKSNNWNICVWVIAITTTCTKFCLWIIDYTNPIFYVKKQLQKWINNSY